MLLGWVAASIVLVVVLLVDVLKHALIVVVVVIVVHCVENIVVRVVGRGRRLDDIGY